MESGCVAVNLILQMYGDWTELIEIRVSTAQSCVIMQLSLIFYLLAEPAKKMYNKDHK